jgi:hypothetical protein
MAYYVHKEEEKSNSGKLNCLFETPATGVWGEAIFATTIEKRLLVLVRHYLIVPNNSNPLIILLRSPQPTKVIAQQI